MSQTTSDQEIRPTAPVAEPYVPQAPYPPGLFEAAKRLIIWAAERRAARLAQGAAPAGPESSTD